MFWQAEKCGSLVREWAEEAAQQVEEWRKRQMRLIRIAPDDGPQINSLQQKLQQLIKYKTTAE